MKLYRASLLSFALALAFTACDNKALLEMETVKKKICACENQACVRALDAEFKATEAKTAKLGQADQEKALALSLATLKCATEISN